ncbi:hypothetical protein VULLAG_LOCUS14038 [Vulpes lagopus]
MRDTQRERQRHRQREKQAPHREPDVGLDPGTPGSRPELKADTELLSHPGVPAAFVSRTLSGKNIMGGHFLPPAKVYQLSPQGGAPRGQMTLEEVGTCPPHVKPVSGHMSSPLRWPAHFLCWRVLPSPQLSEPGNSTSTHSQNQSRGRRVGGFSCTPGGPSSVP